jgi:hypothetical protein
LFALASSDFNAIFANASLFLFFGGINSYLTVLCWDLKQDGSAIVAGEERLSLPSTMFASHAP